MPDRAPSVGFLASLRLLYRDHPVAASLLALALVALGAFAVKLLLARLSEEPPIRVKNGSLDVQLLSTIVKWKQNGSLTKWKLDVDPRAADSYDVVISSSNAECAQPQTTGYVKVSYSDNSWVEIESVGRHTHVNASANLLNPSGQLLRHTDLGSSIGYINAIYTSKGGQPFCTFSAGGQLYEAWLH